jgi:hypothetical protein
MVSMNKPVPAFSPMRLIERHAFALFFLIMGAVVTFWVAPRVAEESQEISELPELDLAAYDAAAPGTRVAVTGVLQDNEEMSGGYVAVARMIWALSPGSDTEGAWRDMGTYVPHLTVAIEGGTITTDRGVGVLLTGAMHEATVLPASGAPSEDGEPAEGTIQARGLRNGDLVTVIGVKTYTGELLPDEIYGGSREEIIAERREPSQIWLIIGPALMVFAVIVGVLLEARRQRIRRRHHGRTVE